MHVPDCNISNLFQWMEYYTNAQRKYIIQKINKVARF